MKKTKRNSIWRELARRLIRNKRAVFAMIILFLLLMIVIFADVIVPYSKAVDQAIMQRFSKPSAEHWFGTDKYGRDQFARTIHGTRISLLIGFGSTIIAAVFGTLIGISAAYFGGKIDNIIMRILDIWMAMPSLLVTLAIIAGLGVGIPQTIIALAFGATPGFARTLRAAALGVASQEFIESSVAQGASHWRIMRHDMIPNVISQILIQFTMNVSYMILLGSTLSFLGLGAQPPIPEWGAMLAEGLQDYQFYPYLVIYPGIFLALTALAINIFGDALRDGFDPKLKGRA
ncbi:MAG: ABC transporter permease [Lachnospiraceae bacterium]|nr:ABC transporter permease [Lachnospiraceae bacterium]